jgi:hypothetical protein
MPFRSGVFVSVRALRRTAVRLARFDDTCGLAFRLGTACSAAFEGRQAQRGGDGLQPTPWSGQAKRAAPPGAKASAMEAEGARRPRRLDAQHDSAPGITGGRKAAAYVGTDAQRFAEPEHRWRRANYKTVNGRDRPFTRFEIAGSDPLLQQAGHDFSQQVVNMFGRNGTG